MANAASSAPATTTVLTAALHVEHGKNNGNANGWASANNNSGSSPDTRRNIFI
uniref:Uncharacterized protein n=1 Tax=Oryza nivara TaxID=4536 RepID=A0A0E0G613_ORYNI